uniref:LIM homeobox transcription factor n=1 Tax=Anopheles culicifacies TaxID=139723 RepID=A0A182MEK0_9DIPT
MTNENANSANSANITANVTGDSNTVVPGPGMNGSNSSCSAKTPITTQPSGPRSSQQGYSSTGGSVTAPTLAEGQRLLLAAVMTAGSGTGELHGEGNGGDSEHLAGLLGTSLCGQCCGPICDRYIMKVVDITYHERCLQCTSCSIRLMHSCFMRDGKLYCRFDYERLYGRNRCLGCGEKIGADELVMRALDNVFHLKCFICVVCGVRLQKGDQYVIKQSQLFCRPDYEKEVEMFQGYSYDDYCCDDMFQTRIDGRRGPKRPRTILTTQQRRAFKASFDISPKPCRKIREGLAKDTGLSIRIVQVWFQNQRAKMKKIQKKQLKEGSKSSHHGGGGGNAGSNKNHNGNNAKGNDSQEELSDNESAVGGKLSLRIKDENSRSNNYLHDSCSDNEGTVTDNDGGPYGGTAARLGLGGSDPYKIVKEELDLEDDYFRMAMSTPNQLLHHHHHHHHQHHPQTPGGRFGGKSFANGKQSKQLLTFTLSVHNYS